MSTMAMATLAMATSSMTVSADASIGRVAPLKVSQVQALRYAPRPASIKQRILRVVADERKGKGGEEGGKKFDDSVFGKMAKSPNFTLLAAAISRAGLEPTLTAPGPLTVFAPNDDAFVAAAKTKGVTKIELVNSPDMPDILKNHVVKGEVLAASLGSEQTTVGGGKLKIEGGKVNGATVKKADFKATNGVIHVVDTILFP